MIPTVVGPVPTAVATAVTWTSYAIAVLCVIPPLLRGWRPPPATWGIWTAAGVVGSIGIAMAGGGPATWGLKLALTVGPAIACMVSVRAGVPWRTTRTDTVCLALAAVGLVFLLFGEGLAAMWLSIAVNAIGTPPTLLHALREPHRESYFPFGCAFVSVSAVLLFAVPWPWTVPSVAYPIYLLLDVTVIMLFIAVGRHRARRRAAFRLTPHTGGITP